MEMFLRRCFEFNRQYLAGTVVPGFVWFPMSLFYLGQFSDVLFLRVLFPWGLPRELGDPIWLLGLAATFLVMYRSSVLVADEQSRPALLQDIWTAAITVALFLYLSFEGGFLFYRAGVEFAGILLTSNTQELIEIVLLVAISGFTVYYHNPDGYDGRMPGRGQKELRSQGAPGGFTES